MILDIILGIFLGILFGFIPSLHINFAAYLFLYFGLFLVFPDKLFFFLSLSVAQLITSYLPQTFFSVPNTENIMSLFPLHRLFLERKAHEAIFLTFLGSFFGSIFALLLLPLLYLLFTSLIGFNYFVSFAILFVFFSFIFSEKTIKDKVIVFFILSSSGLLGLLTLKYNIFIKEPLFVCVVGLFTLPLLLKSIFEKKILVKQEVLEKVSFNTKDSIGLSFIGSLASMFIILVPSFSSSQAGTIVSRIKRNLSSREYIILFSSISISALIFSYFLAMFFYKPRLGYIAILLQESLIIPRFEVILFVVTIILSVCFTLLILQSILKNIVHFINNLNLNKVNIFIFIFCILLVILTSKLISLPILFLSAVIGYFPLHYNKSRVLLMAYIMLPTLLFYL
jgi:TctA family transporter